MIEHSQPATSIELPDYDDVLRMEEEELPSYLQAVNSANQID